MNEIFRRDTDRDQRTVSCMFVGSTVGYLVSCSSEGIKNTTQQLPTTNFAEVLRAVVQKQPPEDAKKCVSESRGESSRYHVMEKQH